VTIMAGVGKFGIVFTETKTETESSHFVGFGPVKGVAVAVTPGKLITVGKPPRGLVVGVDAAAGAGGVGGAGGVTFGKGGEEIFAGAGFSTTVYRTQGAGGAAGFAIGISWQTGPQAGRPDPRSLFAANDATSVKGPPLQPAMKPVRDQQ